MGGHYNQYGVGPGLFRSRRWRCSFNTTALQKVYNRGVVKKTLIHKGVWLLLRPAGCNERHHRNPKRKNDMKHMQTLPLLLLTLAVGAQAQDDSSSEWRRSVGVTASVAPRYLGSDDYHATIGPDFTFTDGVVASSAAMRPHIPRRLTNHSQSQPSQSRYRSTKGGFK